MSANQPPPDHPEAPPRSLPAGAGSARLTIQRVSCSHDPSYVAIRINDANGGIKIELTLEDFALAITGMSEIPCSLRIIRKQNVPVVTIATPTPEA
jgi:hypothetical protein